MYVYIYICVCVYVYVYVYVWQVFVGEAIWNVFRGWVEAMETMNKIVDEVNKDGHRRPLDKFDFLDDPDGEMRAYQVSLCALYWKCRHIVVIIWSVWRNFMFQCVITQGYLFIHMFPSHFVPQFHWFFPVPIHAIFHRNPYVPSWDPFPVTINHAVKPIV